MLGEAQSEALRRRLGQADEDELVTSAIAFAEVMHGSTRGKPPPLDQLESMMRQIPVLPFDDRAARIYAKLSFERGSYDKLIGAHALSLGLIVVTNNDKDFVGIPDLRIENWT